MHAFGPSGRPGTSRRLILERRPWVRYRGPDDGDPAVLREPATLHDVCAGGAGLLLADCPEVGTELELELPLGPLGQLRAVRARVVYTRPHPGGGWRVGCAFAEELPPEELRTLVGGDA